MTSECVEILRWSAPLRRRQPGLRPPDYKAKQRAAARERYRARPAEQRKAARRAAYQRNGERERERQRVKHATNGEAKRARERARYYSDPLKYVRRAMLREAALKICRALLDELEAPPIPFRISVRLGAACRGAKLVAPRPPYLVTAVPSGLIWASRRFARGPFLKAD